MEARGGRALEQGPASEVDPDMSLLDPVEADDNTEQYREQYTSRSSHDGDHNLHRIF